MMGEWALQVGMALAGAVGFGLLFRVPAGKLAAIAVGGALDWVAYLAAFAWHGDRVMAFFAAALATAVLAELFARMIKTPVITLLVPMLVPLVPGGDLYYTTLALVQGDMAAFAQYGGLVVKEAGAISFGIILVACAVQTVLRAAAVIRNKRA